MTGLVITGTGTGVGKTMVTAAIAALAVGRAARCTVVKPAQTGVTDSEPGDLAEVARLAGAAVELVELVRYPAPLSPAAAARHSRRPPLDLAHCLHALVEAQRASDLVLVEGAGGLLVRYDEDGLTLADIARAMRWPVLVVAAAGLGTLNATALTLEAVAARGLELAGLVLGSWPAAPGLCERSNIADLEAISGRLLSGALAEGACGSNDFGALAAAGTGPTLGGQFDASAFRRSAAL